MPTVWALWGTFGGRFYFCPLFFLRVFRHSILPLRPQPRWTLRCTPTHVVNGVLKYRRTAHCAMAMEIALAIPPDNSRVPKGILGPLTERYGVGSGYRTKPRRGCEVRITNIMEHDLSNRRRIGRPSLLTPTQGRGTADDQRVKIWHLRSGKCPISREKPGGDTAQGP